MTSHAAVGVVLLGLTLTSLRCAPGTLAAARSRGRLGAGAAGERGRAPGPAVPPRILSPLRDAALPVAPIVAWRLWLGGGPLLVALSLLAGGAGAAVVVVVVWVVVPAALLALRRGAAGRAVDAALPDALEAVARSLRGGAGTHHALRDVAAATTGPLGEELDRVCAELAGGAALEQALSALEQRRREPGVRLTVAALLVGAEAGGAHARALDGVAESIRSRGRTAAEVRALAAQAQLSAVVIAIAPVIFGVLAAGADGATATFLLRTPLGLACLVLGLLLDGVGALWMRRIASVGRWA